MAHHFISYSSTIRETVLELADELIAGPPSLPVWFDRREMRPAEDWDDQINDAIKSCDTLLFVMTPDSVRSNSVCKQEWTRALKYKKPIVPLLFDHEAEMPFRLEPRQYIDFTGNWDAAVARLRRHLQWLKSPKGILHSLKERLTDAERDRERADEDQLTRIETEIEQLKEQIAEQQRIASNPEKAAKRTEQSIKRGIERERFPEKSVSGINRTKFINPPPVVAPAYFQGRAVETNLVAQFLADESTRVITMAGRGGIGKTALICRLLKSLERGVLPDDGGELSVDGIVYLSANGTRRVNLPNIFADLSQFLPQTTAADLDALYKNAQVSTKAKMQRLLEHFPGGRYVVLLDNFEDVIDSESQSITDAELAEALIALLEAPHHGVKVIITTRILPQDLIFTQPGRQGRVDLDEGLPSPYAENILRAMDAGGRIGLRDADPALLDSARELTRGYPRALEALFAILAADRSTTLQELLTDSSQKLPENVVKELVGEAFSRLDPLGQQVMQALAIYGRPVSHIAVDHLLQTYVPSINSASVLNRLVNMHFVSKEVGRYHLHPVDRQYALDRIPEGIPVDRNRHRKQRWTQIALLDRGADYFEKTRKPRAQWKTLEDLAPQLAEFELRYAGEDYETAASVLDGINSDYLQLWGYYLLLKELYEPLEDKLNNPVQKLILMSSIGNAHRGLGNYHRAIDYYKQELSIARTIGHRQGEGVALGDLGNIYLSLGDYLLSISYIQQSLEIDQKLDDHLGKEYSLGRLGIAYQHLGNYGRAIDYHQQQLDIAREIRNRQGEGVALGSLGLSYFNLGDYKRAIDYHRQYLSIARELSDRANEGIALGNLAEVLFEQGQFGEAIHYARESAVIADAISSPYIGSYTHSYLARIYLYTNDLDSARAVVETALQYNDPQNNHNALALLGIIALRQGHHTAAREGFIKAITAAGSMIALAAQNVEALYAKALALSGLALIEGEQHIPAAIEAYRAARHVTKAAGVVAKAVRLLDALAVADEQGMLKDVRAAAAGEE